MITATAQPTITELNQFIRQVGSFPISARQLQLIARRKGASRKIVDFYRTFAPDRQFKDRDELSASSEQVEMMRQAEAQTPKEEEKATEDY
jgi:hypothetical protein